MGNIDKKVLSNVYKASKIGLDSVEYLYGKIEDRKMKNEINEYAKKYFNILSQTKNKLQNIIDKSIDYTPVNNELMWNGIQDIDINTKKEDIAKILIEGSKKGIADVIHYANNEMLNDEVRKLADNLITYEKQNIENMEKYI